ncbi:hypothetical protein [Lactococcus lactis]|uniref:hypothetical protein n=1 Tax=Lactococcus lactis TaxID=1358 RepID=UPI00189C0F01|nr:hypothetical protein [Lactococcus lactis]
MKKIPFIGISIMIAASLSACSEPDQKPTLDIPKSVVTNSSKTAKINGKTTPNTTVDVGYGDEGDSDISDQYGNFTLKYELDEVNNQDSVKVTAKNKAGKITKEILVKQNPEVIKEKESKAEEAIKEKAESDAAAVAAAKEAADEKNPATYPTLSYDEMARNGNKHKGEKLQITGKVIQVTDGDDGDATLRIATDGDYDDVYIVQIDSSEWENHRLLEDDQITLYGKVYGLYTYESTLGGNITVPALNVTFY